MPSPRAFIPLRRLPAIPRSLRESFAASLLVLLPLACGGDQSQSTQTQPPPPPPDPELPKPPADAPYKNASLSPEARLADLLPRMTLEEKIGQMTQPARGYFSEADIAMYGLGSILSGGGGAPGDNTPSGWAAMVDGYQQKAMSSRLAIPMLYGVDAVHGHNNALNAVLFPHNIGLGAANDPGLVTRIGQATAEEMKATGVRWTFAPCVAVPQDERWGRTYEGFGEIPSLSADLGAALVTGLQGAQIDGNSVLACTKHFVADGGTQGGDDQGNAVISESVLRNLHLPPYESAINAGTATIMASYNSWNGVKMHGNKFLLTDVLRGEMGFTGFVVSDWDAVNQLPGSAASDKIATAVNAGVDMVMLANTYSGFRASLKALVEGGSVPQSRIDEAVSRILLLKFKMGLFEKPYSDTAFRSNFGTAAHKALAREAVAKSAVLLKNDPVTLPIASSVHRILVVGGKADDMGIQCGGWSVTWQGSAGAITEGTTLREAIEAAAADKGGITVDYSATGILPAGATAPDLVIVAIGETPYAEFEGDSATLELPAEDTTVFNAARAHNKPVVTVLFSGRPMLVNSFITNSSAFLAAWLPGTEADGLADLLFGTTSPTGKLPHTWPANLEQVPINQGDGQTPLFALGDGLTYP
jgi:beta-glucosidase